MKARFVFSALCVLAIPLRGAATSSPDATDNPYAAIAEGNAFRLNPPPVPPVFEPPPPVLPEIKVSGFVVNGNKVRALFASTTKNPKEPPIYYDLEEGETEGILALVKINLDKDEADIVNSGVPMHVSLRNNGFQIPEVKAAPVQPIAAQQPMVLRPAPPAPPPPPGYVVAPNEENHARRGMR